MCCILVYEHQHSNWEIIPRLVLNNTYRATVLNSKSPENHNAPCETTIAAIEIKVVDLKFYILHSSEKVYFHPCGDRKNKKIPYYSSSNNDRYFHQQKNNY